MTSEKDAPAEMPGEIERAFNLAARAMQRRFGSSGSEEDIEAALSEFFAPILAEELHHVTGERITRKDLNNAHRKGAEEGRLAAHLIDGVNSPLNACCNRDQCKALEARALAAEAALAEAEERCAKWADKVAAAIRAEEFELASARLRPEPIPRTQKRADDPTNGAAG